MSLEQRMQVDCTGFKREARYSMVMRVTKKRGGCQWASPPAQPPVIGFDMRAHSRDSHNSTSTSVLEHHCVLYFPYDCWKCFWVAWRLDYHLAASRSRLMQIPVSSLLPQTPPPRKTKTATSLHFLDLNQAAARILSSRDCQPAAAWLCDCSTSPRL